MTMRKTLGRGRRPHSRQVPAPSKEKIVAMSCHETIQVWQITKRDFGAYERDKKDFRCREETVWNPGSFQ